MFHDYIHLSDQEIIFRRTIDSFTYKYLLGILYVPKVGVGDNDMNKYGFSVPIESLQKNRLGIKGPQTSTCLHKMLGGGKHQEENTGGVKDNCSVGMEWEYDSCELGKEANQEINRETSQLLV